MSIIPLNENRRTGCISPGRRQQLTTHSFSLRNGQRRTTRNISKRGIIRSYGTRESTFLWIPGSTLCVGPMILFEISFLDSVNGELKTRHCLSCMSHRSQANPVTATTEFHSLETGKHQSRTPIMNLIASLS
jgi:hypothetical protein